ncbi:MAG: MAPEG family protein [Myxococcales bacterium]|nr:MAPEG family protein [Myxococcales bacterium]MCB9671446.1 MAPEG family protein [Alphaproteobacteria bacterium]MCB9693308.1 MAPEG family protein [Alphaproteobacteria bacterium]
MVDIHAYTGPVLVTLATILVYYLFQGHVARVKTRLARDYAARGEKFDRYFGDDREMLAADRIQLNMLEHMPGFLVLLWLNAAFVSPSSATIAGGIWLAARVAYPFLMGGRLGRGIKASILLATLPGYLVILWFVVALVLQLLR